MIALHQIGQLGRLQALKVGRAERQLVEAQATLTAADRRLAAAIAAEAVAVAAIGAARAVLAADPARAPLHLASLTRANQRRADAADDIAAASDARREAAADRQAAAARLAARRGRADAMTARLSAIMVTARRIAEDRAAEDSAPRVPAR